ncbi:hypothetical protein ACVBGC_11875 [Burkholderia stagnalis]
MRSAICRRIQKKDARQAGLRTALSGLRSRLSGDARFALLVGLRGRWIAARARNRSDLVACAEMTGAAPDRAGYRAAYPVSAQETHDAKARGFMSRHASVTDLSNIADVNVDVRPFNALALRRDVTCLSGSHRGGFSVA